MCIVNYSGYYRLVYRSFTIMLFEVNYLTYLGVLVSLVQITTTCNGPENKTLINQVKSQPTVTPTYSVHTVLEEL